MYFCVYTYASERYVLADANAYMYIDILWGGYD